MGLKKSKPGRSPVCVDTTFSIANLLGRRGVRARNFRRSRSFFFLFATGNNRGNDGQHGDDSDQFLHTRVSIPEAPAGHKHFFWAVARVKYFHDIFSCIKKFAKRVFCY